MLAFKFLSSLLSSTKNFYPNKNISNRKTSYTLMCVINGAKSLDAPLTYQWTKNSDTLMQKAITISNSSVLIFSPLRLSDAGRYTCHATVSSPYLRTDITLTESWNIIFSQS